MVQTEDLIFQDQIEGDEECARLPGISFEGLRHTMDIIVGQLSEDHSNSAPMG
jgi:hypothetical protein